MSEAVPKKVRLVPRVKLRLSLKAAKGRGVQQSRVVSAKGASVFLVIALYFNWACPVCVRVKRFLDLLSQFNRSQKERGQFALAPYTKSLYANAILPEIDSDLWFLCDLPRQTWKP